MCTSEIVIYPDEILRSCAKDVEDIEDLEVKKLIAAMKKTIGAFGHCVGLAANQIGSDLNVFVADASKNSRAKSDFGFIVMINPKVIHSANPVVNREGCMSVPNLTGNVTRFQKISVQGLDEFGKEIMLSAIDFEARVFQHEIDHLSGKVFLDRVKSARDVFARKSYRS